jgi:hypothetical protein
MDGSPRISLCKSIDFFLMVVADSNSEEHQRRSADCIFFGFSSTSNAKATKVKKGRSSKASRLSTQSVDIAATDDLPMHDETLDGDASILSTATDMTTASSATTKAKKGGKASKGRAKGKAAVKAQDEPIPEPEDDSFDVKVAEEPKPVARGRKRTSDQVDQGDVAPQAKRRGTRARSSTVKPEPVLVPGNHEDRQMTDAEDAILYPATKEVKGRKRASSTTRKASNVSTASKAPLRSALPADTEIEAALEADLDRPLSDEERSAEQAEGRSLASAKTDNNKAPASTASVRQANKTSMEFQGESALINTQMEVDDTMNTVDEPATQINMPKGRQVKQGTKKIAADDIVNSQMVESQASESTAEVSSKPARKGRQASRQTSRQKAKQPRTRPIQPETTVDGRNGGGIYTAPDEAGHIPDVSQTSVKRGKQASIGATEGRKPKNSNGASQNIEHVAGPASDMPSMPGAFVEAEEIEDAAEEATVQPAKPKGRGRPKGKKNSAVTNSKEALQAAEILEPIEMPRVRESIQATTEELLEDEPEATKQMSPSPAVSPPPVVIEVETSEPVLNERENQLEAEAEPSIVPQATPKRSSPARQIPSPTPSPQSSDAENQPPSSRPSQTRPPLGQVSPNKRVQIVATTPTGGSKKASSSLQSSIPWTAVDVEDILLGSAKSNKENGPRSTAIELSSHEREMTVEEWIMQNAKQSEDRLRNECERMVAKFENEGVRAMKVLEGINTSDG